MFWAVQFMVGHWISQLIFKNRVLYTEIIKDKFNQTFNGINFQYKTKTGKELVHH